SQRLRASYAKQGDLEAVELPYQASGLSMVVLLPEVGKLKEAEASLSVDRVSALLKALSGAEVDLTMPKFKYESTFQLDKTLSEMGMPDAFSADAADFAGMTGKKDLFIDCVVHKAYVLVDEAGTEAAAATGITFAPTAIMPQKQVVVV